MSQIQQRHPPFVRKRRNHDRENDRLGSTSRHRCPEGYELRRLLADVEADQKVLRLRQDELESHLLAAPAADWHEAAEKARYLLNLFAATLAAQDPRRQKLIVAVIADFDRLGSQS
jgi:hypothetical protein